MSANSTVEGKVILSDVVTHMKYAKFLPEKSRRETWDEICDRLEKMHTKRWPMYQDSIKEAMSYVRRKEILPSMRAVQFAGKAIEAKNNRIFNCSYAPITSVKSFSDLFYNLLCGSGTGFSVQSCHVNQLPKFIRRANETKDHTIADTIEGWADSLGELIQSYTKGGPKIRFIYDKIRAEGTPLITSGGRAPGPEPLRVALIKVEELIEDALNELGPESTCVKLRPIHIHDICCIVADAVYAGGIRRAAMISFFDKDDIEMLECKKAGTNYRPERGRANNSAVFVRGEVTAEEYHEFYRYVRSNGTGDPGIYWTNDRDVLSNPCVEASLNPNEFCNLTSVNGDSCRNERDFRNRVIMAARLGTLQAAYTDFSYLSPSWKEQTERSALLGVSITGIATGKVHKYNLQAAAAAVVFENQKWARKLGIRPAARTTCIKPEGTGSTVVMTANGIHGWESEYYFRTIRIGKNEPIYKYLLNMVPTLIEDDLEKPDTMSVLRMPIQANKGGILKTKETALQLLERVRLFHRNWVVPGHVWGVNTHSISCTVSVKEDEWDDVQSWKWENRDEYNGIAAFPFWGGTHRQLPFSPCTKEEYLEGVRGVQSIDLRDVEETEDLTTISDTVACVGGACSIL